MKKNSLINKIISFLPILLVVVLAVIVVVSTYRPGTILSGWDTLHPEFNLELYTSRVFWGAWQDHQGLGAAAAQAHLAELPRIPVLWLLRGLFGVNTVRYIFILSMYVFGGISAYWYIKYVWFEDKLEKEKDQKGFWGREQSSIAAALGALFYLFNLGTLQHFQLPLEMFAVHFATFGLVLGSIHLFLKKGTKKLAIFVFLAQILSMPSAHTATLFYVYTSLILGYGLVLSLLNLNKSKAYLKRLQIVILLIIAANSFWIVPNLTYALNNSGEMAQAKINRNFSDEAFWKNQAFGDLRNLVISKNFLFNWKQYDNQNQQFVEIFQDWDQHLKSVEFFWPVILGLVFVSGIVLSFRSRKKHKLPLLLIFAVSFVFLNNLNFPSSILYKIIISTSSTLEEALRFPFTKFSIVFVFAGSVLLAEVLMFLLKKVSKLDSKIPVFEKLGLISFLTIVVISLGIIYPMKPLLEGKLVSEKVKVEIPEEYFDLFAWFSKKPANQRIAMMPIFDFWPWTYYDWTDQGSLNGYQGGGFLWFGLKQPLLNREFDRWAPQNENFYHEISNAIYQNDPDQFAQVLRKYDVSWLLYDQNIIDPQETKNVYEPSSGAFHSGNGTDIKTYQQNFDNLVSSLENISQEKTFGNLVVYQVKNREDIQTTIDQISSSQDKVLEDVVYLQMGDYVSNSNYDLDWPFSQLKSEIPPGIFQTPEGNWQIDSQVSSNVDKIYLPDWGETNSYLPIKISGILSGANLTLKIESLLPSLLISDNKTPLSNFASTNSIQIDQEVDFESDYYQTKIGEETSVLEPGVSGEQPLGVVFIKPGENLEITLEASYDRRSQTVIIPASSLSELMPQKADVLLEESIEAFSIEYDQNLAKTLSRNILPTQSYFEQNCSEHGEASFTDDKDSRLFSAKGGGVVCQGFLINNLPYNNGYLLELETKNLTGPSFNIQASKVGDSEPFFQESLEKNATNSVYGVFPVQDNLNQDYLDLSLLIYNKSYGSYEVKTRLNDINILPIPTSYLINITSSKNQSSIGENKTEVIAELEPKTTDWYSFENYQHESGIIVLKQSYDKGWVAISLSNPWKPLTHLKYNTWANAWEINQENTEILVFFWPQLTVWLGFVIIFGIFIWILRYNFPKNKKSRKKTKFNLKKIRNVFYEKKTKENL